jgi:fibronectin type 3 domain-containing protein
MRSGRYRTQFGRRFGFLYLLALALVTAIVLASCARDLSAVESLAAVADGTSLDISWEAVSGATGYEVFLSDSPDVSSQSYTENVLTSSTSTTVSDLTVGDTYYLMVTATSLYGFSVGATSDVISVNITGNPATPVPVITAISASPAVASVGDSVLFAATTSDSSGDTLDYTWSLNGSVIAGPTANLNQYTWTATASGSYTIEVTVTDGSSSASAQTSFSVES